MEKNKNLKEDLQKNKNVFIPIAGIVPESIVDGPGYRYTIFTQGCPHNCKGCHNPSTHATKCNQYNSVESIITEIKNNKLIDGITFSGGEPFLHVEKLLPIAQFAQSIGLSVMCYTGYLYEDLIKKPEYLIFLNHIDILADGKFEIENRSLKLKYVGSTNQRLILAKKSIKQNKICFWKDIEEEI